ncbi:MAG: type II secretion system protein GspN [Nitrospirae bacterium]|nr:type II secretion system protein GspN [Nitrospirota bacterium]
MENRVRSLSFIFVPIVLIFIAILFLWIALVQEPKIAEIINGLTSENVKVEMKGFKRGLFFNISMDRLTLKGRGEEIICIEDISVRINPLYLFLLRIKASFAGKIQNGLVAGVISINSNKRLMKIKIDNADIKDIGLFAKIGIQGTGILNARLRMENNSGEIKFGIENAKLETANFSGISVPINLFNKIKGLVTINGNVAEINSVSLEGADVYGRVKGTIKNNVADLNLELMPEASARNNFFVLSLIDKYQVSPGYYVIPIKTRLSF